MCQDDGHVFLHTFAASNAQLVRLVVLKVIASRLTVAL